jgi:hypothetical protein
MVNKKIFFLICAIVFPGLEVSAEDITSRYSMPSMKRAPLGIHRQVTLLAIRLSTTSELAPLYKPLRKDLLMLSGG